MWANFEDDPCRDECIQKVFLLLSIVRHCKTHLDAKNLHEFGYKNVCLRLIFTVYYVDITTLQETHFLVLHTFYKKQFCALSIIPIEKEETVADSRKACDKKNLVVLQR